MANLTHITVNGLQALTRSDRKSKRRNFRAACMTRKEQQAAALTGYMMFSVTTEIGHAIADRGHLLPIEVPTCEHCKVLLDRALEKMGPPEKRKRAFISTPLNLITKRY